MGLHGVLSGSIGLPGALWGSLGISVALWGSLGSLGSLGLSRGFWLSLSNSGALRGSRGLRWGYGRLSGWGSLGLYRAFWGFLLSLGFSGTRSAPGATWGSLVLLCSSLGPFMGLSDKLWGSGTRWGSLGLSTSLWASLGLSGVVVVLVLEKKLLHCSDGLHGSMDNYGCVVKCVDTHAAWSPL